MKELAISLNPGISVNAQPKPDPASERVIYEQPLSERIRSFLRLEHLFERAQFHLNSGDPWSSRNTLECIISVQSVLSRADLKKELINAIAFDLHTMMFPQSFLDAPKIDAPDEKTLAS